MTYFQNPFDQDFYGTLVISDRQYNMTFEVPQNLNRSDLMIAWTAEPYNLSVNNTLTVNFSTMPNFTYFSTITINVAGATPSATLASEVVTALNNNVTFASFFVASVTSLVTSGPNPLPPQTVQIRSTRPKVNIKTYIGNDGAEQALNFNKKSGVAQIPSYFSRYTITNSPNFPETTPQLVQLNPADPGDALVITNSGQNPGIVLDDWQLFGGRSGIFNFSLYTYDGSNRVTQLIQFPAGAKVGDFASKTQYQYVGASTNPSVVTMIPYVLTSGDISAATPP